MSLKEGDKSTWAAILIRGQEGKGALETVLTCIVIGIVTGVLFPYYHNTLQEAKEVALRTGLLNIRKTVQLYHLVERQYPPDLKSLVQKRLMLPGREDTFFLEEYLNAVTFNPEGKLLDPFQNPYRYDSKSGKVISGTEGYETW
jgi:hypothetical protein